MSVRVAPPKRDIEPNNLKTSRYEKPKAGFSTRRDRNSDKLTLFKVIDHGVDNQLVLLFGIQVREIFF